MNKPLRVPNESSNLRQIDLPRLADRGPPQTRTDIGSACGLAYFADVMYADCAHTCLAAGHRPFCARLQSASISTMVGNLKALTNGAQVIFKFGTNASRYIFRAFACRFNRRVNQRVPRAH